MKIFLDTEFTDFLEPQLISLGMVADSGEEFYVELPYPDAKCSPFVREAVIPLLGQYPDAACDAMVFRMRVLNWLQIVRRNDEAVDICIDYQTDWDLFVDAMDYRIPGWCNALHVGRDINELLRYTWHQKNGKPEHHALYDAHANRYAYRPRIKSNEA